MPDAMAAPDRGIFYVALGDFHFREALRSAASARRFMPGLARAILTDQPIEDATLFDVVIPGTASAQPFRDKLLGLRESPFARSLFVDSDTLFCDDCAEVFDLLDRFDLAFAHDPKRYHVSTSRLSTAFPEPNTGVLLYRQSAEFQQFWQRWLALYDVASAEYDQPTWDQPAFRDAIYDSPLRFTILPQQYHARYLNAGLLNGPVKILHGREVEQFPPIDVVARFINREQGLRVYVAGHLYAFQRSRRWHAGRSVRYLGRFSYALWYVSLLHLRRSVQERGLLGTLRFILRRAWQGPKS